MSDIDFQNGFICGMATKGLVRSGELYKPTVWNDPGVYHYFYIDFRQEMSLFSLGMFNESIIVYDSVQIPVTAISLVSTGVYQVFCNVEGKDRGVTVINKKSSLLSFASGQQLPVFSSIFYVEGLQPVMRMAYAYEIANLGERHMLPCTENAAVEFGEYFPAGLLESAQFTHVQYLANENLNISYWTS